MAKKENKNDSLQLITFNIDKDKDKDLVEMLDDAPKTWIIKRALRMYKKLEDSMWDRLVEEEISNKKNKKDDDGDDVELKF
ncbi:hypothetical protein API480_23 [Paenibacillus phage vB_PlaP_API480]|uniref:Uncharacterized protein n=1 Tax=Paenibacillus larvae subsp. larvae TaxID=147375 RepID=A0A6C0QZ70_9BACL|nr:hypothetical protein [Paenibacillus larvae]QBX06385.1 hypothetical protein API480_23 [Paenibacillus phage vB_PlaP_API480]QHZ54024.1 hypothetical protein ERICV_05040 [Paenibacillus larvae subsp. larvae]QWE49686.1 hypothetical protein [Paenibacillus phage SV21]